jgi:hypothetical protein
MIKLLHALCGIWLLALTALSPGIAYGLEYQCAHELVIRSVAVEYQEPEQQVPCKVVYHKPPHAPSVLWQAQAQAGFCEHRAKELVRTLERSGSSCDEIQAAAAREEIEAPPDKEPQQEDLAVRPAQSKVEGGTSRGLANANLQRHANELPEDTIFARTLARGLRRLEDLTGAQVQASSTSFGDLNGDGQRDAAVLITFHFGGTNDVQHLIAYLYRQGTYRPAASRFIGGSHRQVQSGELEAIKAGVILLDLHVLQPQGAACCAPGRGKAKFVLNSRELTRVEEATAIAIR